MFFLFLILYLGPVTVFSLPTIFITRERAEWTLLDYPALLVPGLIWFALTYQNYVVKTLSNLFEPLLLAGIVVLAVVFRSSKKPSTPRRKATWLLWAVGTAASVLVYFLIPGLPE